MTVEKRDVSSCYSFQKDALFNHWMNDAFSKGRRHSPFEKALFIRIKLAGNVSQKSLKLRTCFVTACLPLSNKESSNSIEYVLLQICCSSTGSTKLTAGITVYYDTHNIPWREFCSCPFLVNKLGSTTYQVIDSQSVMKMHHEHLNAIMENRYFISTWP